jgi:hypothetical protein
MIAYLFTFTTMDLFTPQPLIILLRIGLRVMYIMSNFGFSFTYFEEHISLNQIHALTDHLGYANVRKKGSNAE